MAKHVLILGGNGALGKAVVDSFARHKWNTLSLDLTANERASRSFLLRPGANWVEQAGLLETELRGALQQQKLAAIVNVAGGWAGGNAADPDFLANCDLMWRQSVQSSVIAAQLAARHGAPGSLLVLSGAASARQPTPFMLAYGMAKAAVHQLTASLAGPESGLPPNATVVALLPSTLDTPGNRAGMPQADTSSWTPLPFVADLVHTWAEGKERPQSGSLVSLVTQSGATRIEVSRS
eukprot:TRINITY_DN20463_c0_g1_i1.p2 TRINITY_DN20463_c0_g1~~TRINITY_DN20463_c0_g1_i1.p2  ORF type:complete len:237 (-),score=34.86 TRINITY_DN20463_c0_g1_i1:11-721(-)